MDEIVEGACGQEISLTAAIRGILEEYDGSQVLLELLQNADDAKSKKVEFILDVRNHQRTALFSDGMAMFQGPSIIASNDSIFTENDLKAIQRVGMGSKRMDPTTTGRFGVGFCSVYHVTDLPCFATGDKIVFFDPHRKYLPNVESGPPGRFIKFTDVNVQNRLRGQLAPFYNISGFKPTKPHLGTIFRLPLRTPEAVTKSELTDIPFSLSDACQMFAEFVEMDSKPLLFLRNVEKISLGVWRDIDDSPKIFHQVALVRPTRIRSMLDDYLATKIVQNEEGSFSRFIASANVDDFPVGGEDVAINVQTHGDYREILNAEFLENVDSVDVNVTNTSTCDQIWHVICGVAPSETSLWEISRTHSYHTLIPAASIAMCLSNSSKQQQGIPIAVDGTAFCFLPLPISTGLPVHVHARFALGRNRRSLIQGNDAIDKKHLVSFNNLILSELVPLLYATAMRYAVQHILKFCNHFESSLYFSLWPQRDQLDAPWSSVIPTFYQQVSVLDVLPVIEGKKWLKARDILFFDAEKAAANLLKQMHDWLQKSKGSSGSALIACAHSGMEIANETDIQRIHSIVSQTGAVIDAPKWIFECFEASHVSVRHLEPHDVYQLSPLVVRNVEDCVVLLRYCLSHLNFDDPEDYKQLRKLPALPLASGHVVSFSSKPFIVCPAALNLLLFNPRLEILSDDLRSSGSAASVMHCPSLLVHPKLVSRLPEFRLLQSCRDALNLRLMDASCLSQIFSYLLPPSWKNASKVAWDPKDPSQPCIAWMMLIWRIICNSPTTPQILDSLSDFPIVPTCDGYLVTFKETSNLIAVHQLQPANKTLADFDILVDSLPSSLVALVQQQQQQRDNIAQLGPAAVHVFEILKKIGCSMLDTSITGVDVPAVMEIAQPTCAGIINILTHMYEQNGAESFSRISEDESVQLLSFCSLDVRQLPSDVAMKLAALPLFPNVSFSSTGQLESTGKLVSIANKIWFQPSNDVAIEDFRPVCGYLNLLRPIPDLLSLYSHLGIKVLTKYDFVANYLLAAISKSKPHSATHISLMEILQKLWPSVCNEQEMIEKLRQTPILPGPDGMLHCASKFADSSVPLLSQFREGWDVVYPFNQHHWSNLLSDAGTVQTIDAHTILTLAREIASNQNHPDCVSRATMLVRFVFENYLTLDLTPAFWEEFRNIPIAPAANPIPSYLAELNNNNNNNQGESMLEYRWQKLICIEGSGEPLDATVVWTQVPVISNTISIPYGLRKHLKLLMTNYNVQVMLKHLRRLVQITEGKVMEVTQYEHLGWSIRSIYRILDETHSLFSSQFDIEFLKKGNWIWLPQTGSGPHRICYTSPQRVFIEISEDIPPYAYRIPTWMMRDCFQVLEAAGVQDFPCLSLCVEIIQHIFIEAKNEPLTSKHLDSVMGLVKCVDAQISQGKTGKKKNESEEMTAIIAALPQLLYLPDTNRCLRPASDLLVPDAPWLESRVNFDQIHIVYEKVPTSIIKIAKIRRMSTAILEIPDEQFEPETTQAFGAEADRWSSNMRSHEFMCGIKRLITHEKDEVGKTGEDDETNNNNNNNKNSLESCLLWIPQFQVKVVNHIKTRFVLLPPGIDAGNGNLEEVSKSVDVTKDSSGSLSARRDKTIYLVALFSANMLLAALATEINKVLLNRLKNLQPLCSILDVQSCDEIPTVLTMLRIRHSLEEKISLGFKIIHSDIAQLRPINENQPLFPGMLLAVNFDESSNEYVLCQVRGEEADGSVVVDVGNMGIKKISRKQLRRKISRREQIAEQQQHNEAKISNNDDENKNNGDGGGETVELVRIEPANPNHWEEEQKLLEEMMPQLQLPVEPEPEDVNRVIVASESDQRVAFDLKVAQRRNIRPGYDILRWGNIHEVAFFLHRGTEFTPELRILVDHSVEVLRDVSKVFDYNAYLVTLFYQPDTESRFIEQKLLFNVWQIEQNAIKHGVEDIRKDAFAYVYFYGLFVHKMGHYHDIVHGTRHDFFMNEMRIEFIMDWIELLESKGFDPALVEQGEHGWMVKQCVF